MSWLRDKLLNQGYAFELFQAIRLLEDLYPQAPPLGGEGPAAEEKVHLRPHRGLGFPPAEVHSIQHLRASWQAPAGERWLVTQTLMGLYGVNSPLPSYFAEMVAQAYQDPDPLRDFLDLFNHRMLSLYHRAWKKHRLATQVDPTGPDRFTLALCALLGHQEVPSDQQWEVAPTRLVRYCGLLGAGPRPPGGLETLLADYFGLEGVEVIPFHRRRLRLPPRDRTRLGARQGQHHRLGQSALLGESIRDSAGQFLLRLGPLDLATFRRLQPGSPAFRELLFLVRLYTRGRLEFVLELVLPREKAPPARLGQCVLGRECWLGSPRHRRARVRLADEVTGIAT